MDKAERSGGAECGWVKLYHPSGVQVTLPVTAAPLDYAAMLAGVSGMLAAGFLAAPPGVGAGEHKDDVGFVVKRLKDNEDGSQTPVIDLYPADDGMKFAVVSVYLNRPDDVSAFEYASGVVLDDVPVYIGANKIERGKSRQTDALVVRAPRPFGVVWRDNPKYDPNEQDTAKKKPKRLFVRWADQRPPAAAAGPRPGEPKSAFERARAELESCDDLASLAYVWEEINELRGELTPAELSSLVAAKDARKGHLQARAGRLFPAGQKATDPSATVRH